MNINEFKRKMKKASKKELNYGIACFVAVAVLLVWWIVGFFA